jgi:N-acetylneuraminic acid mutarotase
MIVIFGRTYTSSETLLTLAYNPKTDEWHRLANPGGVARIPEAVWTGRQVILWDRDSYAPSTDQGYRYDPTTDTWAALPDLPAGSSTSWGSIAWTGDEVIVYGSSAEDESRVAGARWRPGDKTWRPLSDPSLPPVTWYDGTPGSQALAWDDATRRLVVWPAHGYEFFDKAMPLLSYDPNTDTWRKLGGQRLGYHPKLVAGGGAVFRPDRNNPVVARITR